MGVINQSAFVTLQAVITTKILLIRGDGCTSIFANEPPETGAWDSLCPTLRYTTRTLQISKSYQNHILMMQYRKNQLTVVQDIYSRGSRPKNGELSFLHERFFETSRSSGKIAHLTCSVWPRCAIKNVEFQPFESQAAT